MLMRCTLAPPCPQVLIPYVPGGVEFESFVDFQPDVTQAIAKAGTYSGTVLGSPYIYGPTLVLIALTTAGTWLQVTLLKAAQRASDQELLLRK